MGTQIPTPDDETRHEEEPQLEMNDGGAPGQDGLRLPQDVLIPGAVEEGWVLFETVTDVTADGVEIRPHEIRPPRNDVHATSE